MIWNSLGLYLRSSVFCSSFVKYNFELFCWIKTICCCWIFVLRTILWMACVLTPKLQVKLSSQFYSWSSITREETFRKFYRNIPYLNPFRLLTSLNSDPWTWQRTWRKSRVKNNRILTVWSNLHNLRAHALQLT